MERAPLPPVPRAPLIKNLELKIGLLLAVTLFLGGAFLLYSLHSRGAFEKTRVLVLTTEDVEGVSVGMPISFSGFPIGQVSRLRLMEDGEVRIELAIPREDARWLRKSSVFTLEKSFVGGAKIKAHSSDLQDTLLEDGAVRPLYTGDDAKDIPELLVKVKSILANIDNMTGSGAPLNRTLGHIETVSARMAGNDGLLGSLVGTPEKAAKVVQTLDRTNALLSSLGNVSLKVDAILAKTDARVFGQNGAMEQAQQSLTQVSTLLGEVRESLRKADAILVNAQTASSDVTRITGNVAAATTDLSTLRLEVDESVRKTNHLINEINRKWPFSRDVEIKTP